MFCKTSSTFIVIKMQSKIDPHPLTALKQCWSSVGRFLYIKFIPLSWSSASSLIKPNLSMSIFTHSFLFILSPPLPSRFVPSIVLRHRKFCQHFRKSFAKILALKVESLRNFDTILTISAQIVISKFRQKRK